MVVSKLLRLGDDEFNFLILKMVVSPLYKSLLFFFHALFLSLSRTKLPLVSLAFSAYV